MKLRTLALLVAMGLAPVALAQAPAAPAAKANIPKFCTNCHKAGPDETFGAFESVAFKSQSIQLKIDAATEIVRFDPKTLKVVDGGRGEDRRRPSRHPQGPRDEDRLRGEGRRQDGHRRSGSRARSRSPPRSS